MICAFVRGGKWVECRKWKNKCAYAEWSMILNEPVQVRFQVEFLSVSVCAGVTHLFIYLFISKATASSRSKWNRFCANQKVIWTQQCLCRSRDPWTPWRAQLALLTFTNQLFNPHSAYVITAYYIHCLLIIIYQMGKGFLAPKCGLKKCLLL